MHDLTSSIVKELSITVSRAMLRCQLQGLHKPSGKCEYFSDSSVQ